MTAFTRTWNAAYEAQPADTESISLGAGRIRDLKTDVQERLEVDHFHAGDAQDGEHKKLTLGAPIAKPANIANKGFLYGKDVNAKIELFYLDEDDNEVQLTSAGALNAPLNMPVVAKTADFTVVAADKGKLFDLDANAGAVTVTLILASGNDGFVLGFKAKDVGNTITIDGNGAETIDGSATIVLTLTDEVVLLTCDGTTWHIIGRSGDEIPAAQLTNVPVPDGALVQMVHVQDGALATGTETIPFDNTIPQNTEGKEYMTLAITPKSTTNRLVIQVVFQGEDTGGGRMIAALFQDSTANALAAMVEAGSLGEGRFISFTHEKAAGTTSATTFKVRAGSNSAGTTTFNGQSGAAKFGGKMASSITIWEVKAS